MFISMSAFVEGALNALSYPFLDTVSFHPYLAFWYSLFCFASPFLGLCIYYIGIIQLSPFFRYAFSALGLGVMAS
jgi:hypothetical protein